MLGQERAEHDSQCCGAMIFSLKGIKFYLF